MTDVADIHADIDALKEFPARSPVTGTRSARWSSKAITRSR